MPRDFSINIFLNRPSWFHFGAHIEMKVSLSGTALKSALPSTLSRNDLGEIGLHENPLWNDDASEEERVEEDGERDRDTEATYSMSIGLRDSTCRSYVETVASGTDNLLVCRIASYIVFVLLMRPDLAAFVRQATAAHKYLRHPSDRTSSFSADRGCKYRSYIKLKTLYQMSKIIPINIIFSPFSNGN